MPSYIYRLIGCKLSKLCQELVRFVFLEEFVGWDKEWCWCNPTWQFSPWRRVRNEPEPQLLTKLFKSVSKLYTVPVSSFVMLKTECSKVMENNS